MVMGLYMGGKYNNKRKKEGTTQEAIVHTITGLKDLLTSGSAHGSLSALKSGVGWPSLRPGPIWCPSRIGVRSGLFLSFINDLPGNIRLSVRLFADDCVLYRNISVILEKIVQL